MALDIISPAHLRMLVWGQRKHCKARRMWRRMLPKFVKFERGVIEGGCATRAATSSYEIMVSILYKDRMHRGAIR